MGLEGNYLTAEMMKELNTALVGLQLKLAKEGYKVPDLYKFLVSANYAPTEIKFLFNKIEENTRTFDSTVDWVNPHSAYFEWKDKNGAIFNRVNRWWKWIDYNYAITNNEMQKSQYLLDEQSTPITDINGERILTYEGYFREVE